MTNIDIGMSSDKQMNPGFGAVGSGSAYAAARKLCACSKPEDDGPDQKGGKKNPWGTVY